MKQIKIAFLGSDGSGKTTLINYIKEQLEKKQISTETSILGWKNFHNPLLKIFSKIYLNSKTKQKQKNQQRLERFRQRSWFFYIIYYIELWTRYFKILNSKKQIILIDRYFYEELAFMNNLKLNFFKKITPKPDLCFVLKADINTIKARGHEVSEQNLNNFYYHLENLSKVLPMIFLDSSLSLNKIYQKVEQQLKIKQIIKK